MYNPKINLRDNEILSWLDLGEDNVYGLDENIANEILLKYKSNYKTIKALDFCQYWMKNRPKLFDTLIQILKDENNQVENIDFHESGLEDEHIVKLFKNLGSNIKEIDISLGEYGLIGIKSISNWLINPNCNLGQLYMGGMGKLPKEATSFFEKSYRKNTSLTVLMLDGTHISKKNLSHLQWLSTLNKNLKKPFNKINYSNLVYKHLILEEKQSKIYFSNANNLSKKLIDISCSCFLYWIISKYVYKDLIHLILGRYWWFFNFENQAFCSIISNIEKNKI